MITSLIPTTKILNEHRPSDTANEFKALKPHSQSDNDQGFTTSTPNDFNYGTISIRFSTTRQMAKRIRTTSEDLVFSWCKRTKRSHHGSGDRIFEGNPPSPRIEGDLIGSNDRPTQDTEQEASAISQQQQGSEESAAAEPEERGLLTPEAYEEKENNGDSHANSNDIASSATPSPPTKQRNNSSNVSREIQRSLTPRRTLPAPKSEPKVERPIVKKQNKFKKSKTQPGFKIFEDKTATRDNITAIEDESYVFAMDDARSFVDKYMQTESFLYGEEVAEWLLPLSKEVDKATVGEKGTTFEKQLIEWKGKNRFRYNQYARSSWKGDWFTTDDVEELAGLVERTIVIAQEKEIVVEVKKFVEEFVLGQKKSRALMIGGFYRGHGFGPESSREEEYYGSLGITWKPKREPEFYERLGEAWRRIVYCHFEEDVWFMSWEMMADGRWDRKMKKRILEIGERGSYVEILRTRWATNSTSTPVRSPLLVLGDELNHSFEEYDFAQEDFENGLD
jgi:hypothetical protein